MAGTGVQASGTRVCYFQCVTLGYEAEFFVALRQANQAAHLFGRLVPGNRYEKRFAGTAFCPEALTG